MSRYLFLIFLILTILTPAVAQKKDNRPYKCGPVIDSYKKLKANYDNYAYLMGVGEGENVASVGASSGYVEVQVAAFVENVNWVIQDIDSACLNQIEFDKVLKYYEGLKKGDIKGSFTLVLGDETKTNLPRNAYDRVLLVNVYHELSDKEEILMDIHGALKEDGVVVIVERMAQKKGDKHANCGHPAAWGPDLLDEMNMAGYKQDHREMDDKGLITYFTFAKR